MTRAPRRIREALGSGLAEILARTPAKVTARRIAADERAVRQWRRAESLPSAEHLILLAREYPEIRMLLRRLMSDTEDASYEQTRTLMELHAAIGRLLRR